MPLHQIFLSVMCILTLIWIRLYRGRGNPGGGPEMLGGGMPAVWVTREITGN